MSLDFRTTLDDSSFQRTLRNMEASTSRFASVGLGGAFATGITAIAKAGDEANMSLARIGAATGNVTEAVNVMSELRQLSSETGAEISDAVGQFSRFSIAARQIGASNAEVIKLIELIQKAGIVSGSTTAEMGAAGTQLGQALASGRFQGDELRSIMENMPILAEALAKNLGVSVGELRELGKEGMLTTDVVFPALLKSAEEISEKFEKMPTGIGRAWGVAKSETAAVLADMDKMLGISTKIASVVQGVPQGFRAFMAYFEDAFETGMGVDFRMFDKPSPSAPSTRTEVTLADKKAAEERAKAEKEAAKAGEASMKEYLRLEAESEEQARKNAADQEKALQRRADMQRAFYVDSLDGAAKLKALEEDLLRLKDREFVVSDAEKAALIEKISLKELEIAKEKELQAERERSARIERINRDIQKFENIRDQTTENAISFGMMSSDERRDQVRNERREKRERDRFDRIRARGGTDARFGANDPNRSIASVNLATESITALRDAIIQILPHS